MHETPNEPRRSDESTEDRRGQNHPSGNVPTGGQPPPPDGDDDIKDEDEHPAPSRRRILSGRRLAAAGCAVVLLAGGGAALALNDGGGDGDTATSLSDNGPSSPEDAAFEFAQCMRDNGIEDFPDPQVDASGDLSIGGSEVADQRDTEEFKAAEEACLPILEAAIPEGEGQKLTPEELAEVRDGWRAVAQCVRDRGFDFPDPEIDEYGRFKGIQAQGEGVEQAVEECINETSLSVPQDGEGGSSTGEDEGA
jgi:hypothetical protein